MIGEKRAAPDAETEQFWAPRIAAAFSDFHRKHCGNGAGAYVLLETLHAAFMDYCLSAGHDRKWVNDFVALNHLRVTLPLALAAGGERRGSRGTVVVSGLELVSYP